MEKNLPKCFDPSNVEHRWYEYWEKNGFFKPSDHRGKERFSIVIPPPNVTGSLHMGHAFCFTLHDVYVRWKRMSGFSTLWLPGTDHAGIATQNVVEKALKQEGITRKEIGRNEFEKRVWQWKEQYGNRIVNQLRKLGTSCDWNRQRFTLDSGLSRAVREVFVRLYSEGLIYKGEYIVNWCPRCETAISDLETEYESEEGHLWYIKYPMKDSSGFITVATTRPETMLGDTAVAVHPDDDRYKSLIGKTLILPLLGREIPIIADEVVEREFGTGAVKVTPSHDPNDFAIGQRHGLLSIKVIDEHGNMSAEAGLYEGLDRIECRERVLGDLEKEGLLSKVEKHLHNVGHCQRCSTVIEPLVSSQWFVKVQPLAEMAINAVKSGRTRFFPKRFENTFFNWMNNIHDWCISRQLWWGHRIPAWYCTKCRHYTVSIDEPDHCVNCGSNSIKQEEDVLDTWFSSALWPFSTLGWPDETEDLKRFYPTDLLITGFDIIFFWVARMIMMGIKFMGDVPFRTVYIHGLVRDENNQKMSKSRGNVIDPLVMMEKYGTDAVRFTLAIMAMPGNDLPLKVDRMAGYRAFANKIWNAARFLMMKLPSETKHVSAADINKIVKESKPDLTIFDRWILSQLNETIDKINKSLEKFLFHEAANSIYHFFWHSFCDWYIELSKPALATPGSDRGKVVSRILLYVLETSLRLLHPFMPFITEEIWQKLPHEGKSIMVAEFPTANHTFQDRDVEVEMDFFQDIVITTRNIRSENNIKPGNKLLLEYFTENESMAEKIERLKEAIKLLANLDEIKRTRTTKNEHGILKGTARGVEIQLHVGDLMDKEVEKQRLQKNILKLETELKKISKKLSNKEFLSKAPHAIIEKNRKKHNEISEKLEVARKAFERF